MPASVPKPRRWRARSRATAAVAVAALLVPLIGASSASALQPTPTPTPTPTPPPSCIQLLIPPVTPGAPTASEITQTSVKLTWTEDPAPVCVPLTQGFGIFDGDTELLSTRGSTTTATVTGLKPSTTYTLTVKAWAGATDNGYRSAPSAPVTFTTQGTVNCNSLVAVPPDPPTAVSVSAISTTDATVSWTPPMPSGFPCGPPAPTGYSVYAGASTDTPLASTNGETSTHLTGLTPGTPYSLTVRSRAVGLVSSPSQPPVSFVTVSDPVVVPYSYTVGGSATLKTLVTGQLPLSGALAAQFSVADGAFTGALQLNPVTAKLTALGVLPVVANLTFAPTAPVAGTYAAGVLKATAKVRIKLSSITVLGFKIGGGAGCQTKNVSAIALTSSTGSFTPQQGGLLVGHFAIGDLVNCGALTGLVSPLTAGSGNAIGLKLTPTI